MAWLYISLLFLILFALMYIRYRNQDQDPLGDLDIPKNKTTQIRKGRKMIVLKIIILILLLVVLFSLFLPLLKEEEYHYDTDGITTIREYEIEKQYLERQLQDMMLDKDSGKISEEEWENVIQPVKEKIQNLEKKIQLLKEKV
ncbi:MAG: hypothetical protein KatS3mg129_2031 [Leptospiraceae bacterium]|nr:MAG: hypothetical protein KatS3mg129_2031 [Leptospiraceae bacterium]